MQGAGPGGSDARAVALAPPLACRGLDGWLEVCASRAPLSASWGLLVVCDVPNKHIQGENKAGWVYHPVFMNVVFSGSPLSHTEEYLLSFSPCCFSSAFVSSLSWIYLLLSSELGVCCLAPTFTRGFWGSSMLFQEPQRLLTQLFGVPDGV